MPAPPPSPPSCLVGDAEVVMLQDAAGTFFTPREAAFPAATPDQWAAADSLDPEAVTADGQWLLRFRCFVVRLPGGRVILVDTGVGPADAPAASWAPLPGRLPQALATAGIAADEIEVVVLTHVHSDHIGWAVTGGRPFFRDARYLLQAAEVAALAEANPEGWACRRRCTGRRPERSSDDGRPQRGTVRGAADDLPVGRGTAQDPALLQDRHGRVRRG